MSAYANAAIADNYRRLLEQYGVGPEVAQWSAEGQRFRFEKLAAVGVGVNATVLDLGCGLGDLYPFLQERIGSVRYSGIDIVPELVARAAATHPDASFVCRDVLVEGIDGTFDYVLMSGVFNNARPDGARFLDAMVSMAFGACTKALAFNFTSTCVNHIDEGMAYHDPAAVLRFCLEHLSRNVVVHHHYERCDVAVYVYR